MRNRLLASIAMLAVGCGGDDEATVAPVVADTAPTSTVAAPVSTERVEVSPQHGGTIVVAGGRYPIEVVAHRSGQVYAWVLLDAPPPDAAELTIEVPVEGRDGPRPLRMRWDAREGRFEARVRRLAIVEGPIDLLFVVGGVEFRGHVDVFVLAPAIEVHVIEHRGKYKHKHKHRHWH